MLGEGPDRGRACSVDALLSLRDAYGVSDPGPGANGARRLQPTAPMPDAGEGSPAPAPGVPACSAPPRRAGLGVTGLARPAGLPAPFCNTRRPGAGEAMIISSARESRT